MPNLLYITLALTSFISISTVHGGRGLQNGSGKHLSSRHGSGTHCPALDSLPPNVYLIISNHSTNEDMANLASTNSPLRDACQYPLELGFEKASVGDTPTFIPAVKRCMIKDDVKCFHAVVKHFKNQNEEKPWRLRQLPALAAQLGATNIFKELNVSEAKNPLWIKWMTRAMAKERRDKFLVEIAPELENDRRAPYMPEKDDLYRLNHIHDDVQKYDPSILAPVEFMYPSLPQQVAKAKTQYSWIDANMTRTDAYPNVTRIFQTLQIEDLEERRNKTAALKREIILILNQGVYLLDDIMGCSANLHKLWWHFGKKESDHNKNKTKMDDDGGRSSFIQWLMDEGAPMNVLDWIRLFYKKWGVGMEPDQGPVAREWIKICSRYVIGSGTGTLNAWLNKYMDGNRRYYVNRAANELPFFKKELGADIYDPSVMKKMLFLIGKEGLEPYGDRGRQIQYYATQGLTMARLKLVKAYYDSLPDSTWRKSTCLEVISKLTLALQKHELDSTPLIEKPAKLLSFWLSLSS